MSSSAIDAILLQGPQGVQGSQGYQGSSGFSSSFYRYNAKTTANSGNPGSTYVLWSNATQTSSSQINISHLSSDNIDVDVFLALLETGSTLIIQDAVNSNNYQKWEVSSAITVFSNSYVEIPVTHVEGTYSFTNEQDIIVAIFNPGPQGPQGAQGAAGARVQQVPRVQQVLREIKERQ